MIRLSDEGYSKLNTALKPTIDKLSVAGWKAELGTHGDLYIFNVSKDQREKIIAILGGEILKIELGDAEVAEIPVKYSQLHRPFLGDRHHLLLKEVPIIDVLPRRTQK